MYILDPFGSRMGSSIFFFKKNYQMEMKLKNKTMPTFKISFFSYCTSFFLKHMNVLPLQFNNCKKKKHIFGKFQ
jgi:hypothetical protein